jgi:hypothetical protein
VAAGRGASIVKNTYESGVFRAIDCSPFIDSLFAGSPIKNCRAEPMSLSNSDTGVTPLSAA